MTRPEPIEAEIVGANPSRDYKKSARQDSQKSHRSQNSGQKFRGRSSVPLRSVRGDDFNNFAKIFRINKIVVILTLILLVCLLGLILKFLVGVLAGLLQFVVMIVAVALVVWLIYNLVKGGEK